VVDLLSGLLIAALVLAALRIGAELCWKAFEHGITLLLERGQIALQTRRVQQHHQQLEQALLQRQQWTSERALQRSVVGLDGKRRLLARHEWDGFLSRCLQELELEEELPNLSWEQVRQHWRRQSLIWHPDRGGAVAAWLRKQRAYEGLEALLPHRNAVASTPWHHRSHAER